MEKEAKFVYVHFGNSGEPMRTEKVPMKTKLLWWQSAGLSYTASGYGAKIPTRHMAKIFGRWYRIYCAIYSNVGSCFVVINGKKVAVRDYE